MPTPEGPNPTQPEFPLETGGAQLARSVRAREENLRRVRHVSNWSLAALLVGVGATSAALAHVIPTHSTPTVYVGTTAGGTPVQPRSTSGQAPNVSGPVAVTSGSGVVQGAGAATAGQVSTSPAGTVTVASTWRDS